MINFTITIPGGADDTFGAGATITTTGTYNGGTCADGTAYVIAPGGIKVAQTSPAQATVDGRIGHGAQASLTQGGLNALDAGTNYDGSAALDTSAVYPVGSCIVKVQSCDPRDPPVGDPDVGRAGLFETPTALFLVPSSRAANVFAPVVWPSDDLANRPWRAADIDGFLASLPSLSSSGGPTWASIKAFWDKLDFALAWGQGVRYQWLTPLNVANTDTAYGRDRSYITGQVLGQVCGNAWSTADKTEAVIRLMSNGCQTVEAYAKTGAVIGEDGGHYQWSLPECLAWLKATGGLSRYSTVMPLIGGNVRGQYYQVSAGMFSPHDTTTGPYISRRRTVSAITGSGPYQVICTGYRPVSGLTEDTADNGVFTGLNMVREANGATALITAQAESGSDWAFTVAALPTGLVVGNVISCDEVTPLSTGAWDWCIRNPSDYPNLRNPSPNAQYRTLNHHGNSIAPISAMGMLGSDLAPAAEYIQRISAQDAYGTGWQQTFWSTHQATVLALPQVV